jgi:hypothetical protein
MNNPSILGFAGIGLAYSRVEEKAYENIGFYLEGGFDTYISSRISIRTNIQYVGLNLRDGNQSLEGGGGILIGVGLNIFFGHAINLK